MWKHWNDGNDKIMEKVNGTNMYKGKWKRMYVNINEVNNDLRELKSCINAGKTTSLGTHFEFVNIADILGTIQMPGIVAGSIGGMF